MPTLSSQHLISLSKIVTPHFAKQFPPDLIFTNARWWFLNLPVKVTISAFRKAVEILLLLCAVRAEHILKLGASLIDWRLQKVFNFHLSFMIQHD